MSKMNAVKAGDRARVTFEGMMDSGNYFTPDGAECGWTIHPPEYDAPTFKIERIEPPLKVGDRVTRAGKNTLLGTIIYERDGKYAVWFDFADGPCPDALPAQELVRA